MFAEDDEIFDPDYVGLLLHICFLDVAEDLYFDEGLLGEAGLVLDDLQRHFFFGLVVEGLEDLPV